MVQGRGECRTGAHAHAQANTQTQKQTETHTDARLCNRVFPCSRRFVATEAYLVPPGPLPEARFGSRARDADVDDARRGGGWVLGRLGSGTVAELVQRVLCRWAVCRAGVCCGLRVVERQQREPFKPWPEMLQPDRHLMESIRVVLNGVLGDRSPLTVYRLLF